jgi:hypothetical protein
MFPSALLRGRTEAVPLTIPNNSLIVHDLVVYGLAIGAMGIVAEVFKSIVFEKKRKQRKGYYSNVYLRSNDWQRKRYVVLKRDNWTCVHCGGRATQVHHKRYARRNIGKEPIEWLVSVCKDCHEDEHRA